MHPLQQPLQEYPEQQTQYTAIRRLLGARKEGQTVRMWAAELCRRREVVGGTQVDRTWPDLSLQSSSGVRDAANG